MWKGKKEKVISFSRLYILLSVKQCSKNLFETLAYQYFVYFNQLGNFHFDV